MDPIYLDHAATSPLRAEVRDSMIPYLKSEFGNPSSTHSWGRRARRALEEAREEVAQQLGVEPREVIFVRGGTEADNLAVLGRLRWARTERGRARALVSTVEHSAVREAAHQAEREGVHLHFLPVGPDAQPDWEALDRGLAATPDLVSVMWVNNETGSILPVEEVARRCRAAGVPFHTDAVQAAGHVPMELNQPLIPLVSLSGHKIGGPKGTGALVVREALELTPLHFGGSQEEGLRSGTQDIAGAVGFATALRLAREERTSEAPRLEALRDALEETLRRGHPTLRVHGDEGPRAPHILNVGIPGVDGPSLIMSLDLQGVAVSQGSACSSGVESQSPVITALYGPEEWDGAVIRFSLGRATTEAHVEEAGRRVLTTLERLEAVEARS